MAGEHHGVGHCRLEQKDAREIGPVVIDRELAITVPSSRPVHLAPENNGEEEENEQVVVFGNRELPHRRFEPPEQKKEKAQGENQTDEAAPEEHLVGDHLEHLELGQELEVTDDEEEKGHVKEHEERP